MRKLSILGFAFLLAACAGLKPDYTKPAVDLPAGWRDAPADGVQARDARWWKVYGDPVLDRLVDEALATMRTSCSRSPASTKRARRFRQPRPINGRKSSASANRSRTRVSQRGPTPLPQGVDPQFNDTR